jgi:two-component system, response regulator
MTLLRPLRPILIAEDDPNDLFFLRRLLNKAGVENPIMSFPDGAAVIEFLQTTATEDANDGQLRPQVIFLDIKMPKMGGFDVLCWMRQQRAFQDLSVIILSGGKEPKDVARAAEFGVTRYLLKYPPVDVFTQIVTEELATRSR